MGIGAEGARRCAEVLLGMYGESVLLRLAQAPAAGEDAAGLGLAAPEFQDVELGPAVWRKTGDRRELLVSAEAVLALVGTLAAASAEALFAAAAGVVVDGTMLPVEGVEAEVCAGEAVCFVVTLQAA